MIFAQLVVYVLTKLGALAFVTTSAYIFGRTALCKAGFRAQDRTVAVAITAGLGLLSQIAFLIGLAGGFKPMVLVASLALGHIACLNTWRQLLGQGRASRAQQLAASLRRHGLWMIPILWWGLYPPMGWDATAYHLPYVRSFLDAGRPLFVEHLRYPVFPQVTETLFLIATVLGGDIAAKLTQTLALLTTGALLAEWGQRLFSSRVGIWAAALWLGTPLAVWLGTLAFVDVQLTLFTIASIYSWQRWQAEPTGQGRRRWLVLAGLFVGMAAGTKYLGLFFCVALGIMSLRQGLSKRSLTPAIVFSLAAIFAFGPWYGRIVWHTGNPVFPFYTPLFGDSEWTTRHDRVVFGTAGISGQPATSAADAQFAQWTRLVDGLGLLARLPWSGVFEREDFFSVAPLTPWYLLLLPVGVPILFLTARGPGYGQPEHGRPDSSRPTRGRRARSLATIAGFYALFWLTIEHDLRFLLPAMPLLNLALAEALDRLGPALRRPASARLLAMFLLAPGICYASYKIWQLGPLPVTAKTRADLLEAKIPGYGGVRWLNEQHGDDFVVYGLYASRLRHYARGQLLGDAWGPLAYRQVASATPNAVALDAQLEKIGARYLLVDRRWLPKSFGTVPGFSSLFTEVWQEPPHLLFERRSPAAEANHSKPAIAPPAAEVLD